ncbi:UDP-glucose 4-epimerase GalE [Phaeovulum sp. W22_SRMD_FR3]|uniref:UDP-glucose 4-epimerase GalE n=1 Tax=Phaeovulum sp. W22_SRMD_FR3 TaxID=3240274 RepID=UPI003F993101
MHVLVTGGAGFIGSHACKALAAGGFLPVTYDSFATGHAEAVRFGPLVRGDVRDTAALVQAMRHHRIGAVMHFAACAYVGESMVDPAKYYDNNVGGMQSLLAAMRQAEVDKIVFSSSCATYGIPAVLPITEASPQHPISPYGRSKLMCEQMLRDFGAAYGLHHISMRYFNAAGADPSGALGEWHEPETHVLPLALMAAAGKRPALEVYGTDYDTPDGTCIRDYIHVSDLARAHVLALHHLRGGGENLALNLGSGQGHSVRDLADAIFRVTGRPVPMIDMPRRAGDPPVLTADPAAAAALLQFRTALSDLDTIVETAAPWFLSEIRHAQSL